MRSDVLPCEDVARAALGPPVKREGAELVWRCTGLQCHRNGDAHPSLKINPKKNTWACFVCGVGGTAWALAAFLAGVSPDDKLAVTKWLKDHGLLNSRSGNGKSQGSGGRAGIPAASTATPQHREGLTLEQYAEAKKLPIDFLRRLGLSTVYLSKQPALRIPYFGLDGFEKAVRFRLQMEKGENDGRFRWKSGSKPLLYGLERLKEAEAQGYLCLVEGESDRHTLCYHCIPALGLPGAGTWREEWSESLKDIPCIYVFLEPDAGGEAVLKWLSNSKIRERTKLIRLQKAKDASALYLANPQDFLRTWNKALGEALPWSELARFEAETRSREAQGKCAGLATRDDILGCLPAVMELLHLAGEQKTVKLVYLAATSRLLPKPISVAVKGPSAGGKSYTVEQTLRLFPNSAYYMLTAMSERALAYSEEPLAHRMLVLYEAAGLSSDFASYLVRSLLSEGRLRYETVEKTSEGVRPRLIEREGPTGLIVTTTQIKLNPENETRLFSIAVNDSQEQTRAVFSALTDEGESEEWESSLEEWRALQRWIELGEHRVTVPYATNLAHSVPPVAVRLRRDFRAILTLIRAHALLHQANRQRDRLGRIVANLGDYAAVRDLVAEIVAEGVDVNVSESIRETVKGVRELSESAGGPVSVSQLANHLGLDRSSVSRRIKQAIEKGYVKNLEDKRGRPFRLAVGDPMPEDVELLPAPEKVGCCSVAGDAEGINGPSPLPEGTIPMTQEARNHSGLPFESETDRLSFADDSEVL